MSTLHEPAAVLFCSSLQEHRNAHHLPPLKSTRTRSQPAPAFFTWCGKLQVYIFPSVYFFTLLKKKKTDPLSCCHPKKENGGVQLRRPRWPSPPHPCTPACLTHIKKKRIYTENDALHRSYRCNLTVFWVTFVRFVSQFVWQSFCAHQQRTLARSSA